MDRFANAVLIGVISGIIASGAMFYALVQAGVLAMAPVDHATLVQADLDRAAEEWAPSANLLEDDLREHARRLDELSAALEKLQTELPADRLVASRSQSRGAPGASPELTVDALINAGFSPEDAAVVISLAQSVELEQMELSFGMRQGPMRSRGALLRERGEGARAAMPSIRAAIVEQFGERGFDQYLYATGQPNRIQVSSVLPESRAQQAGFESGDVIVEVAGEAVYSNRDLYRIANEGMAGELVPITVSRGLTEVEVYAERGPLGVRTNRLSIKPG